MFWRKKHLQTDSVPGWFGKQLEENIRALRQGDKIRIAWILCVFTENHEQSRLLAARALRDTLDTLSFNEIVCIDRQIRQTTSMEWSIDWCGLDVNSFFTSQMDTQDKRALIVFSSFNPNGYIREQAVKAMQDYDMTLPFIILRQNDWVLQVRQAASMAYAYRMQRLSGGELLAALPFAEKLNRGSRGAHDEFAGLFFTALTSPEHSQDLIHGLRSKEIRTRRICIDALFRVNPPKTELAFAHLVYESEPFLRATIFRKLNSLGQDLNDVIRAFLQDKYPLNRLLAFQYILEKDKSIEGNAFAGHAFDVAQRLLLDKNAMVRAAAQQTVQEQEPQFDFHGFYLDNLDKNTAAAISGLGEKGHALDAVVLNEYLSDARVSVVKSTMVTLVKLDEDNSIHVITEKLDDSRAGITKTAGKLVMKAKLPNYERVREIFFATTYKHTKLKCLDILFSAPKWSGILFMLETLSSNDEHIREKSFTAITGWLFRFNRSFSSPSEEQVVRIKQMIQKHNEESPPILPLSVQKELLFTLPF